MQEFKKDFDDILACPICLDLLDRPVLLSCPHSMCMACAQSWVDSNGGTSQTHIECPQCKVKTPLLGRTEAEEDETALIHAAFGRMGLRVSSSKPR